MGPMVQGALYSNYRGPESIPELPWRLEVAWFKPMRGDYDSELTRKESAKWLGTLGTIRIEDRTFKVGVCFWEFGLFTSNPVPCFFPKINQRCSMYNAEAT